jgi:dihydroorotate dehydrogenase (fumarate)
MADLSTTWLGLELNNPVVAGASPLSAELDTAKALADAGAGAIVLPSLFEEQILFEQFSMSDHLDDHGEAHAEAVSYFPEAVTYHLGPERYLQHLTALKTAVSIPVIASLNGVSPGGWTRYARKMEDAGADAIELNLFYLPTDPDEGPDQVELRYLHVLQSVCGEVKIPVAVKLSPFFSSPVHFARRLAEGGAAGAVIFNRFYQPDIDIEELEATPSLHLSDSSALLLRLRWLAAMYGPVPMDLSATGGVHTTQDVIKALMAGANAVQLASALLKNGPGHITGLLDGLGEWLDEHGYTGVSQMIGSMSLDRCPDPQAFQRTNYMTILKSWRR